MERIRQWIALFFDGLPYSEEAARARGVDVSCDVYPYPASMTTITSLLPSRNLEGGVEKLLPRRDKTAAPAPAAPEK